jgi:hypothetical protein
LVFKLVLLLQHQTKTNNIMTQLESTQAINKLKVKAIRKGGYAKFKEQILTACAKHKELFGVDLTPKHLV